MTAIKWDENSKNLSVIDYIAIQAMVGLLSGNKLPPFTNREQQQLSELSYQIAWKMCKEGGFDE